MHIHITAPNLPSGTQLVELARRRAGFALDRFSELVRDVEIRLRDVNGPRGGPGIACLTRLRLTTGGHVVAESAACTPEESLALALERLGSRLRRLVSRRQDHR
jgi:putative sigma-54 modulation protein